MESLTDSVNKRLDHFADLNTPGWDSYSANSIALETIEMAKQFWASVVELLGEGIKAPHVVPCPSGGIQFEWERESVPPSYLEIELFPDGCVEYLYLYKFKETEGEVKPETGMQIMRRFFAGEALSEPV